MRLRALLGIAFLPASVSVTPAEQNPLRLWYDRPAESWVRGRASVSS